MVGLEALAYWQWFKRRRRVRVAKVDIAYEDNEEEKASVMSKTMRPIEEKRRKAMSKRIMREKERGKKN